MFLTPAGSSVRWIVWIGVVGAAAGALLIRSAPYLRAAVADRKAHKMLQALIAIDGGQVQRGGEEGAPHEDRDGERHVARAAIEVQLQVLNGDLNGVINR